MAVNRGKYHIQLKRTKLSVTDATIQSYPLVFGEPVYLDTDKRLTIGPPPAVGSTGTVIPNCSAVKLVSQNLEDPDDSNTYIPVVDRGVFYKNRTEENIVQLTDDTANKIYPITKMSAVTDDGTYTLSEYLVRKVNIDNVSLEPYPSLGYDSDGVFVDRFEPEQASADLGESLANIVNKKVSIDDSSAVTQDLSLGRDLYGIYVRVPGSSVDDMNYIKSYIDMMLDESINTRLLALESNVYYLQQLINNVGFVHVGSTPPVDTNKLWIDTTTLTGGLKYCSDKTNTVWSHVPVAYT